MTHKFILDVDTLANTEIYKFVDRNINGERIVFWISKNGTFKRWGFKFKEHWRVECYVYTTDEKGWETCYSRYNPYLVWDKEEKKQVLNRAWILEATPGNKERLLNEIERRFFNGIDE